MPEPWILQGRGRYQIHRSAKQIFQIFFKFQQARKSGAKIVASRKFDQKIQITPVGIEIACVGRPKKFQPPDAKSPAKRNQRLSFYFNQTIHNQLFFASGPGLAQQQFYDLE